MFFSKIVLMNEKLHITTLSELARESGYRLHQRLWRMFAEPSVKERDFNYRQETENGWPCFFVVSQREPLRSEGLWQILTKPYMPRIRSGESLAFVLRANPVKTSKNGENGKPARHDVIMAAKTRLREQGIPKSEWPSSTEIVQTESFRWLEARTARCGFSITEHTVRADAYQQHSYSHPRRKAPICFSTVDYTGLLTVIDPGQFVNTLYQGIGHCKGFGCGMIMVRRV